MKVSKFVLALGACVLTSVACAAQNETTARSADEGVVVTAAAASWQEGDVVFRNEGNYYRVFQGVTEQGRPIVQNFYEGTDVKSTEPYVLLSFDSITQEKPEIDGHYVGWHENGEKRLELDYDNGKEQGLVQQWHSNGQISVEATYRDGLREGASTDWYSNGQKMIEYFYVNGLKHGHVQQWHENGNLHIEVDYKDGKRHGTLTEWDENGNKILEISYEDGAEIGRRDFKPDM